MSGLTRRDAGGALLAALCSGGTRAQPASGAALPSYARVDKLAGRVAGSGSSTVAAVLKQVSDGFESAQPGIEVELGGAGSGTALAAMLAAPNALGLLSRALTSSERDALRARRGRAPAELKIAMDALAIYVFKRNPVKAFTLADLRRAFGRDADAAQRWGELGADQAEWRDVPLARFGIERGRGAHDLFRELVLEGREFAAQIDNEPVSTSIVQGVGTHGGGIGYASVFFRTARTRVVPLTVQGEAVEPTAAQALSGRYPLARYLYVVADAPSLEPAQRQFLRYVLSDDGQQAIARQGMFPLDARSAAESLALLGDTAR